MANITDTQLAAGNPNPGAGLVGYQSSATNSVVRSELAKWREHGRISPEDFGAVGDGSTDDTLALQRFFAALQPGWTGMLGPKTYVFRSPLTLPLVDKVTLQGSNSYSSRLLYTGTNTNVNLVTLGDSFRETRGWQMKDFMIDSSTQMTGGHALYLRRTIFCGYDGLVLTGQYDGTQVNATLKLFHGVGFEGFFYSTWERSDIAVRSAGMRISGPGGYGAGLSISGGNKIGGCGIGIHVGGGATAVLIDEIDVIGNVDNALRIDNALVPGAGNGAIMCGSRVSFDSSQTGDVVWINDTAQNGTVPYILFTGSWIATSPQYSLRVTNCGRSSGGNNGFIRFIGGNCSNSAAGNVLIETTVPDILFDGVSFINSGNGYGLRRSPNSQDVKNVRVKNCKFFGNVAGDYSGSFVGLQDVWTPRFYGADGNLMLNQPTVTYAEFIEEGPLDNQKIITFTVKFTLPSSPSGGTGTFTFNPPWNGQSAREFVMSGITSSGSVRALTGVLSGNLVRVFDTNNMSGNIVFGNEQYQISGTYIAQNSRP